MKTRSSNRLKSPQRVGRADIYSGIDQRTRLQLSTSLPCLILCFAIKVAERLPTMISLLIIVGLYIVFYMLWVHVIVPTFLSPLSKIPNAHFTSSISSLWILWKRYTEHENRVIHAAHVKHGDIVRLGPNEISINCVDGGIRTVYSGGFEKSAWYPNQFDNYG